MLEIFRDAYYYLDLLVGFGSAVLFFALYKTGRIDKFIWHIFWIGAAAGALWEIPIFVLSGEATSLPLIVWNRPLVAHYSVFMVCHSLWDGLLFVIGVWLVRRTCRAPHFLKFRWPEFLVFIAWGQVSELCVELSSTMNDGWSYVEYWWNPVMFQFNGHNIAWLMQWVWFAAAALFYMLLIKLKPKYS